MIDKFQKLFGPNPPRPAAPGVDEVNYGSAPEDDAHRKQVARIKNKRRLLGILVLLMAAAVVAPSFFEPNDYYADRGAKLEIPALQNEEPAKVVSLAPEKAKPLPQTPVLPKAPSSAANLSSANKVSEGVKPAPRDEESSAEAAAGKKTAQGAQGNQKAASQQKAAAQKSAAPKAQSANKSKNSSPVPAAEPIRAVANGRYFIQVIATSNKESAQIRAQKLRELGLPAYTEIVHRRGTDLWRVRVGRFASEQEARRALDVLAFNAIENGGVNQEPAGKKN